MRVFITVVALVVLAGIAWFYFSADEAGPMAEETAGEVATEAEPVVEDTGEAAEATDDTADTASDVLDNTLGTDTDAGDAMADADGDAGDSLADALTVEGFDADRLRTAVDSSSLGEAEKQAAIALIDSAEQNPDLVQPVIEQLQTEFGL